MTRLRRIVYLLLLFCLPLYGYAMQSGLPSAAGATSLLHQVEHDEGVQHHHHEEDGSVHYDESDESLDHAQEHSSPAQPAGFGLPSLTVPPEQPVSETKPYLARPVPEPFLDGPHRPPARTPGPAAGGMLHA